MDLISHLGSLPDKPSNVHNLKERWDLALGLIEIAEPLEAVIWNIHSRLQVMRKSFTHCRVAHL
jgi:hypothetical protein